MLSIICIGVSFTIIFKTEYLMHFPANLWGNFSAYKRSKVQIRPTSAWCTGQLWLQPISPKVRKFEGS